LKEPTHSCLNKILSGGKISRTEADMLADEAKTEDLLEAAGRIRNEFVKGPVELCSIINAKSGLCPEDCSYCAQSTAHHAEVEEYPLLEPDKVLSQALENESFGVRRFSIVTSGKSIDDSELPALIGLIRLLREKTRLFICASLGCATTSQLSQLKGAGLHLFHHNLETGRRFFPKTCSTHTYDERVQTLRNSKQVGIPICSGGIFGMGESMSDRLDMAFELMNLGVKSVPVNFLDAIQGTPFEGVGAIRPEDALRSLAIYRFILPDAVIRYAGGRMHLGESQKTGLQTAVNGMMVGNYLTTVGNKIPDDLAMLKSLGLEY
jgi:biotin synthase